VQISIEGVNTLYSDTLPVFFKKLYKDTQVLRGMHKLEQDAIIAAVSGDDKGVPAKGHVIEIRGYTYHERGEDFIIKSILENLKAPEQDNVNPGMSRMPDPKDPSKFISSEMKTQIMDNLGFFVVYKIEKVQNPEPGVFAHIKTSQLRTLLKGEQANGGGGGPGGAGLGPAPGMQPMGMGNNPQMGGGGGAAGEGAPKGPDRDSWTPLGVIAAQALGAGGGGGFGGGAGFGGGGKIMVAQDRAGNERPMIGGAAPQPAVATGPRQPRWEFIILFVWKEPALQVAGNEPAR
jgi:hypothetical protein